MQFSLQNASEAMAQTFEGALEARAQAMADACTRCGKCVEVCPVTGQTSTHLPQRVQASAIAWARASNAASKVCTTGSAECCEGLCITAYLLPISANVTPRPAGLKALRRRCKTLIPSNPQFLPIPSPATGLFLQMTVQHAAIARQYDGEF